MADEFFVVDQEVSLRFADLRSFWALIKREATVPPNAQPYTFNAGSGLTVVYLYATLEFCLSRSVRQISQLINDYGVRTADICTPLMCLVHDPKLKALVSAGQKTRLRSRLQLFNGTKSVDVARIYDEFLAPEMQNVWSKSIIDVFAVFGLSYQPISGSIGLGYIDRVVGDRNAVAHGRETPEVIGKQYGIVEIEKTIAIIERECRGIVNTFKTYYDNREFIARSFRHRYLRRDIK